MVRGSALRLRADGESPQTTGRKVFGCIQGPFLSELFSTSQPIQNGGALIISGGGVTWANNLAVNGTISVTSLGAPTLNYDNNGTSLQFSWTGNFKLQSQTNALSVGLRTNWFDYPGGGSSPVTVPINPANPTVFFRLISQ